MEHYIVSARKYRPQSFRDVVGQQALAHTLVSAIRSQRLAHAYLFCGPRGVGKTSCARIFAKTINCEYLSAEGEACGECESCRAFAEGRSYNIVELDAASNNSVDDIRNLVEQVRIPPQIGRYKVFIIDEVHMLSQAAFNAFLKTLEEPPAHAIFILATTEKQKIIPTILSRCQIYDFSRITVQDIVEQLQRIAAAEGISAEPQALNIIAQKADGAMRDALSIFDQVAASSRGNITYRSTIENLNVLDYEYYFRLIDTFSRGDVQQALLIFKEILDHGFDAHFFINGLAAHFRDLMVAAHPATLPLLEVSDEVATRYSQQAASIPVERLYRAMAICNDCDLQYRNATNKRLLVELALIRLCQLGFNQSSSMQESAESAGGDTKPALKPVTGAAASSPAAAAPAAPVAAPTPAAAPAAAAAAAATPAAPAAPVAAAPSTPARHVTTPAATPARPVRPIGAPRISITGKSTAPAATAPVKADGSDQSDRSDKADKDYTDADFAAAWQSVIAAHPHEKLLTAAMSVAVPARRPGNSYTLELQNPAQMKAITPLLPEVNAQLRNALGNSTVTLEARIVESSHAEKLLSPQDVVAQMMATDDNFRLLVDTFRLGLA